MSVDYCFRASCAFVIYQTLHNVFRLFPTQIDVHITLEFKVCASARVANTTQTRPHRVLLLCLAAQEILCRGTLRGVALVRFGALLLLQARERIRHLSAPPAQKLKLNISFFFVAALSRRVGAKRSNFYSGSKCLRDDR